MTFLVLFVLLIVMLLSILLVLYRGHERDELRQINLDLLAAEYGARFFPFSTWLAKNLQTNYLCLGRRDEKTKNVLTIDSADGRGALFETHIYSGTTTTPAGDYTGIWVEFPANAVPNFKISQKWLAERANYTPIPADKLPAWIPAQLAVIAQEDDEEEVITFLNGNRQLEQFLTKSDFMKMFFRGRQLVLYLNGKGDIHYSHFEPLIQDLKGLSQLSGRPLSPADTEPPLAIRLLKAETN